MRPIHPACRTASTAERTLVFKQPYFQELLLMLLTSWMNMKRLRASARVNPSLHTTAQHSTCWALLVQLDPQPLVVLSSLRDTHGYCIYCAQRRGPWSSTPLWVHAWDNPAQPCMNQLSRAAAR